MDSDDEQQERRRDDDAGDDDANADLTLDIVARASRRQKQSRVDEIEAERQQQRISQEQEHIVQSKQKLMQKLKQKRKNDKADKRGKRKRAGVIDVTDEEEQVIVDQSGKTFVVQGKGTSMSDPLVIFEQTPRSDVVKPVDRVPKNTTQQKKRRKNRSLPEDELPAELSRKPESDDSDEPAFVAYADSDGAEAPPTPPDAPATPEVVTVGGIKEDTPPEGGLGGIKEDTPPEGGATGKKNSRFRRYFDPPPGEDDKVFYEACFNCGETGHYAIECTEERRRRPCYVCGECTHEGRLCPQKAECYICNQVGHLAKECPLKGRSKASSRRCLHCGDSGHDVSSCRKDYDLEDLKAVQCYVCERFGHLCCTDGLENFPRQASCYNCGAMGHTGMGCARSRNFASEGTPKSSVSQCYKCGGEGHFARGCSQGKWPGVWDENDQGDFPRGHQSRESRARNSNYATPSKPQQSNYATPSKPQQSNYATPSKSQHKRQESLMDDLVKNANMRLRKWQDNSNEVEGRQERPSTSRRGSFSRSNQHSKTPTFADY